MELLVLGIGIMALGAAILHLAIEGRKAAPVPVAATRTLSRPHLLTRVEPFKAAARAKLTAVVASSRLRAVRVDEDFEDLDDDSDDVPAIRPLRSESFGASEMFGKNDILLADALTELIDLKEQVSSLQARIDELTSEAPAPKQAAPKQISPKQVVEQPRAYRQIRRRAHGFAS